MTLARLRHRLNRLRTEVPLMWRGLPHGCDQHLDIARRLKRTRIELLFDVGANRGQSVAAFKRWYPDAVVHCFEPVSATFRILSTKISGLPGVHAHNLGFGAKTGPVSMTLLPDDTRAYVGPPRADESTEVVQLETLDAYCERDHISSIDYLKIDTEGHDFAVLQGGENLLRRGSAAIVEVEASMNPDNRFHASAESLTHCLESYGYRLFGVYEQVLEWPTADAYLRRANLVFISPETVRRNRRSR